MRLRQFKAASSSAAIAQVRDELGHDAVILSTHTDSAGVVHITAATDAPALDPAEALAETIAATETAAAPTNDHLPGIRLLLDDHAVADDLTDCLLEAAHANPASTEDDALAAALGHVLTFDPIPDRPDRPVFLVGPPGCGKTVTTAKLAARARLAGTSVRVISTDTVKAGGMTQLEALTKVLGVGLRQANDAAELRATAAASAGGDLVVIDSLGVNPFDTAELNEATALIAAANAEPVAVLPASLEIASATAAIEAFAAIGCRRLIATHLDMTVRLGAILTAAHQAGLTFAELSNTPAIAGGLTPASPALLAGWLARGTTGQSRRPDEVPSPSSQSNGTPS